MSKVDLDRAVIGAVVERPDLLATIDLDPTAFSRHEDRVAWSIIQEMGAGGEAIDSLLLVQRMLEREVPKAHSYVADLPSGILGDFSPSRVQDYVAEIQERADRMVLKKAIAELGQSSAPIDELLRRGYEALDTIGARHATQQTTEALDAALDAELAAIASEAKGEGGTRLGTGYASLDELVGGWTPGNVSVVAGRPSMGKSSLVRSFAWAAVKAGHATLSISLEDTTQSLRRRQLSDVSGVPLTCLTRPEYMTPGQYRAVEKASAKLKPYADRWLMDGRKWLDARAIGRLVRRYKRSHDLKLVTIDYIQIMACPGVKDGDKMREIDISLQLLNQIASQEQVAILVVSQLNRGSESGEKKVGLPQLRHLKHSGKIEEIAEHVVFPWNPRYYLDKGQPLEKGLDQTMFVVAKNKNGPVGMVHDVRWDPSTATYRPGVR